MDHPIDDPAGRGFLRRHTRRATVAVAGGTTILVGIVLIPLPGPGSLVILGGLSILGKEFPRARRPVERARRLVETSTERSRRAWQTLRHTPDGTGASRPDR